MSCALNAHSTTVVFSRVDPSSKGSYPSSSNQRSFMRPATSVYLVPSSTRDASVECNEPTDKCMCESTPPPVLPDVSDGSTQSNLPDVCSTSTQCDLKPIRRPPSIFFRFDSVDRTDLFRASKKPNSLQMPRSKSFVTKSTQ